MTSADVSHEGFPFATCRVIEIGPVRVLASRISYVGDLGWELYVPIEQGARLWDIVWEAGHAHGAVTCGIGVYGTTGRLEKSYRAFGTELESEYTVVEADMAWGKVKDEDFVGKEAHLGHRDDEPAAILCTLSVDDHTSASGVEALPTGARTDSHERRRAARRLEGPPLLRDERRLGAVRRQVRPHVIPSSGPAQSSEPDSPSSTWASSTRSPSTSSALPLSSTPRTRGSALEEFWSASSEFP